MSKTRLHQTKNSAQQAIDELNQRLYSSRRRLRGLTELSRSLDHKIEFFRVQIEQHRNLSESLSYKLGKLLFEAKSVKGLKKIPSGFIEIVKLSKKRQAIRQARQLLESNGFKVIRVKSPKNVTIPEKLINPKGHLVNSSNQARSVFDDLLRVASTIPDSNGSQYYRPIDLNIAIVTDEFMFNYYRSIFKNVVYVTPDNYEEAFRIHDIQLFLYVSCWSGISNDEWRGIAYREKPKNALNNIIALSKAKGIPTVFQTIEDPSNYEHYLPIAQKFEHIVTTDVDCIQLYQRDTNAKSVSYGEYGVNPLFNNPIGIRRKVHQGAFFAGSYPSRYTERCHDMHVVFDSLIASGYDLIIADRNSDKPHESVAFPARYANYLVPKIDHRLLQKVHKVFKYSVNFNSIKTSPSMCAMRIYELQAQGSLLMSNYAKSVVNNFPLVDVINTQVNAAAYFDSSDMFSDYEKQVASIRNIMTSKTGFEQARVILTNIGLQVTEMLTPLVIVIVKDATDEKVTHMFERQRYANKILVDTSKVSSIPVLEYAYYAIFSHDYEYEENYLIDMVNGFKYTNSRYVTKAAYFDGVRFNDGPQHEFVETLPSIYRSVFDAQLFDAETLLRMPENYPCEGGYSIDPFELNYTRYLEAIQVPTIDYALSVIVPVFNNGEFLRYKCMESLRRNALFSQMEILLVDDGSTDSATLETIALFKRRYSNVKVYHFNDGGSGSASRPRNKGVQLATAPLITYLDPDNEISPNGYDNLYSLFIKQEQQGRLLDLISGYQIKVGVKQSITAKHTNKQLILIDDPRNNLLLSRDFPIISTQAAIIRKEFLINSKVDFVQNAVGQDTLYGHELLARASCVGFSNDAHIVYYADRTDSVTNTINLRFFQKSLILEKAQHERFAAIGLLESYIEHKFKKFFDGWYLEKLKVTDINIRPDAIKILNEILAMYGFPSLSFDNRGV